MVMSNVMMVQMSLMTSVASVICSSAVQPVVKTLSYSLAHTGIKSRGVVKRVGLRLG